MPRTAAAREDPRVPRTREVVLGIAADLIAERGYAGLTMDALVERTGVSKITMYKHWPSRSSLIAAAVQALTSTPTVPGTDGVRNDLILLALDSVDAYKGARWPVLASVLEAAGHDPELRVALHTVSTTRFVTLRAVLERAVQLGQLRTDLNIDTAIIVLVGAIFVRLRTADLPQVKHDIPTLIDAALTGLASSSRAGRSTRPAR